MSEELLSPAMQKVARRFAARLPSKIAEIRVAMADIRAGDISQLEPLRAILHDFAGASAPVGYAVLGDYARAAENSAIALRDATPEDRMAYVDSLESSVARLTAHADDVDTAE